MAGDKLDTSVFTDDTGERRRAVALAIRGAVGLLGIGAAAVAISVFGHVKLPGLDAPLHVPGVARHQSSDDSPDSKAGDPGTGALSTPGAVAPADGSTTGAAGTPTTAPTAAPTTKATGKPTAKPTTARGTRTGKPTAPPGKPTNKPTR